MEEKKLKLKWKGTRVGFVDENGNWVIEPIYENAHPFQEGLAAVKNNEDKWGFINPEGLLVIEHQYDKVDDFINGLAIVNDGENFIDKEGTPLYDKEKNGGISFYQVHPFSDGLSLVRNNDDEGYIDLQGKLVIDLTYRQSGDFVEDLAAAKKTSKKARISTTDYGYIDKNGNWKIEPQFEKAKAFSEGLAAVKKDDNDFSWGFINREGDYIIPAQFYGVSDFHNGLASVGTNVNGTLKKGLIDVKGNWILEPEFEYNRRWGLDYAFDGIFLLNKIDSDGEKWGAYSKEEGWVIAPKYESIDFDPYNKVFFVKDNGKTGIMNQKGEWLLSPKYDDIEKIGGSDKKSNFFKFSLKKKYGILDISDYSEICKPQFSDIEYACDGIYEVRKGKKLGLLDREGNIFAEPKYTGFENLTFGKDGLLKVKGGNKYGYINREGKEIIPPIYDEVDKPINGMFHVRKDGKYGFIDMEGKIIAEPVFDEIKKFGEDGIGAVKINKQWGFVNRDGELVGGKYFDGFAPFNCGVAPVKEGDKWYIMDKTGDKVSSNSFGYIYEFNKEGVAIVYEDEKYGLVNSTGKVIFDINADEIWEIEKLNFLSFKTNEKFGILDLRGHIIYEPIYDSYIEFFDGLLALNLNGKWGFADKKGGWDMPPSFEDYHYFSKYGIIVNYGYARVGDKWGFIGHDGKGWLINPRFDEIIETKQEDIFVIKENDKVGIANRRTGMLLEPQQAEDAGMFYYDEKGNEYFFKLKVNGKWGIVDVNGKWIVEPSFDEIGKHIDVQYAYPSEFYTTFIKDGKKGYIKWNGEVMIEPLYDDIYEFNNKIARVRVADKYGFIDINGKIIAPPVYDQAEDFSWDGTAKVMKGIKVLKLNTKGEEIPV